MNNPTRDGVGNADTAVVKFGELIAGHTPGPWELPSGPYIIKDTGEGSMFSGGDWNIFPPLGECGPVAVVNGEANARLIAVAPDYHSAAAALIARHDAEARASNFQTCGCVDCKPFRAVIAKITNRAAVGAHE